ncbi:hypothetical protein [Mucilaginibacter sp. HD30]
MTTYQKTSLISVDEAITKGRQMLLLPRIVMVVGLFLFLFPITLILIGIFEGPPFTTNVWLVCTAVTVFCFVVFFYLPYLFWSKRTTRWKLWAFDNVDDVHELKIMATEAHLCPAYGTVMDKLQFQSTEEREQWRNLQDRFNFRSAFKDDPDIPARIEVFYSKLHLIINILFALLFVAIGSVIEHLTIKHDGPTSLKIIAAVIALVPTFLVFRSVQRMIKKQPELVLDNQGLYSEQTGFLNWDLIFNEKVTRVDQGKRGVKFTFSFQHPGGIVNIDISDFNISKGRLERLVRVYKGRYGS